MTDTPLRLDLDRSSPVPLYHQLASSIEAAITDGRLKPGSSLENEIALAARLGISRPTARQALKSLVDRGLLVRRRGVGTQVAPTQIHRRVGLTSLYDDLAGSGQQPRTELLEWQRLEATADIAASLESEEGPRRDDQAAPARGRRPHRGADQLSARGARAVGGGPRAHRSLRVPA